MGLARRRLGSRAPASRVRARLPPFGYTQRRGPFTLAHWVELVRAFDAKLGIRRPVLVGHSLGAAVAVAAALARPRTVAGIVLLDGDALPVGGGATVALAPAPESVLHVDLPDRHGIRLARRACRAGSARSAGTPPSHGQLELWERQFRVARNGGRVSPPFRRRRQRRFHRRSAARSRAAPRRLGRARHRGRRRCGETYRARARRAVRARPRGGPSLDARSAACGRGRRRAPRRVSGRASRRDGRAAPADRRRRRCAPPTVG